MTPFYFLNVYKPRGITSFDVIFKLRKILNIRKIGHSGTLDPMAEGVLQIAVGNATRLLEFLPSDKEYTAEIRFGYTSTTLDSEGEIQKLKVSPCFTKEELVSKLQEYTGEIVQTPPKFSAIKVDGQKLCNLARKNPEQDIYVPERKVIIRNIELIYFDYENYCAKIKVSCSKGTYIRSLADDIAKALNTRAYLTSLIRTKAGNFKIEESIKIQDITKETEGINPIDAFYFKKYNLNENEYKLVKNGVKIVPRSCFDENETLLLIYNEKLVSIAVLSDNTIVIKKNFTQE